ncbi:MAG: DUF2142 domain-containing protein [Clostridium sp.]|nr:DUF2142 domain-containing protein [Clostridium sp.]
MDSNTKVRVKDIKWNIVIVTALITGLLVLIFLSGKSTKMEYSEQKFGVLQDYTLKVDDDVKLRIDFTLESDDLKGIAVYLLFNGIEYEEAYLDFTLFDQNTDEVIGKYSMDLEYEYSAKYAYIELPVKDSKNRNVYLTITGQNIKQPLQLKISKKGVSEQKLYKNGNKVRGALVMNAVYGKKTSNAVNVYVNYIIYVIVVLLIFYNRKGEKKRNESERKRKSLAINIRLIKRIKFFWAKYGRKLKFVIMVLVFACIFIFYYNLIISDLLKEKKQVTEIEAVDGKYLLMDKEHAIMEQTFISSDNKLSGLSISCYGEDVDKNSCIDVKIMDVENGNTILEREYMVTEFTGKKETEVYIPCNENILQSKEKEYILLIEAVNFGETRFYIAQSEKFKYKKYKLSMNEHELQSDVALKMTYSDQDFILNLYVIFVCLVFLVLCVLYLTIYFKRFCIENLCLIFTCLFGLIYMCVITIYGVPDESSHMDTAYRYSNRLLGIEKSERVGYDYKRVGDVDVLTDQPERTTVNINSYQRFYNGFFSRIEDGNLVECYMRDNSNNGGFLLYWASTLGLTIARILHWGTIPMYMLGRLFNLLAYCVLVYAAVKILPYGKTMMTLLATLPISLQQAASFSYDALLNGYIMLFIAYCLYLANEKRNLFTYDILFLTVMMLLLASSKGGVYIPICLLVLYIPYKRNYRSLRSYLVYGFVFITAIVMFGKSYIVYLLQKLTASQGTISSGANGTENYTFGYLLKHPLKLVSLFCNTVFERTDAYLQNILGGSLGWFNIHIPWTYCIIFLIILLLSASTITTKINKKDRLLFMFITVCCFILVNFSMLIVWTPKTSDYIVGVQGRYFLPFIFLTIAGGSVSVLKIEKERGLIWTTAIMHCLVLLRVIVVTL